MFQRGDTEAYGCEDLDKEGETIDRGINKYFQAKIVKVVMKLMTRNA